MALVLARPGDAAGRSTAPTAIRDLKRGQLRLLRPTPGGLADRGARAAIVARQLFLDDAAKGKLPQVSWIDPNFVDLSVLDPTRTTITRRLTSAPARRWCSTSTRRCCDRPRWEDTLLVVTYDEHGGFYDHVAPPRLPADDRRGDDTDLWPARAGADRRPARGSGGAARAARGRGRPADDQPQFDHTAISRRSCWRSPTIRTPP